MMAAGSDLSMTLPIWRMGPEDAALWRDIRLDALARAPDAFEAKLADWRGRPLVDFASRLARVATFAAGNRTGPVLATASWQGDECGSVADPAWLLAVYVRPEARGLGLGRAIVKAALSDAWTGGRTCCALHVRADNPRALALYASIGFVDAGDKGVPSTDGMSVRRMVLTRPFDA